MKWELVKGGSCLIGVFTFLHAHSREAEGTDSTLLGDQRRLHPWRFRTVFSCFLTNIKSDVWKGRPLLMLHVILTLVGGPIQYWRNLQIPTAPLLPYLKKTRRDFPTEGGWKLWGATERGKLTSQMDSSHPGLLLFMPFCCSLTHGIRLTPVTKKILRKWWGVISEARP